MKIFKTKNISFSVLLTLAVVVLAVSAVKVSTAYFTTYVTARGHLTISLESEVEINEEVGNLFKKISIANTGECPCWTRIRYFVPQSFAYAIKTDIGDNWYNEDDGYWYYTRQLQPGEDTNISQAEGTSDSFKIWADVLPEIDGKLPEGFNIIVVAECVPVGDVNEKYNDSNVNWNIPARNK